MTTTKALRKTLADHERVQREVAKAFTAIEDGLTLIEDREARRATRSRNRDNDPATMFPALNGRVSVP